MHEVWDHRQSGCQSAQNDPQATLMGGHDQSQSLEVLGIIYVHSSVHGMGKKNVSKDGLMPGKILMMDSTFCSTSYPQTSKKATGL